MAIESDKQAVALALVLPLLLVGCSQETADEEPSTKLIAAATCTREFDITAELAIPGEIRGIDCYDANNGIELVYRTAAEDDILHMSEQTWYPTPAAPLYVTRGPDWFILANDDNRRAIEDVIPGQSFEDLGIPDDEDDDPYGYGPQTCAQFASALSFSYAYEGIDLPDNTSDAARDLFESSFSDLIETGKLQEYSQDSPEVLILLGNHSHSINQFCADGGDIFDGF